MQAPPPRWQFVRFVVAAGLSVPVNIGQHEPLGFMTDGQGDRAS